MKLILFLVCGVVFSHNFAFGRLDLNSNDSVGVSQEHLEEYMRKAFKGFKHIMLQGDEELEYPVMDPYKLEPFSWEYVDTSGSKKYRLNFFNQNSTIIKGLSHYSTTGIKVSAKNMTLSLKLWFSNLEIELPYKLDGYLFKKFMPVYGEGLIKVSTNLQVLNAAVDLGIDRGYVTVEDVQIIRHNNNNANVKVTGLMDLSNSFASAAMGNILDQLLEQHADKALTKFARNLVEEAIGGMTAEELFDLLDHFVKKK